MGLERLNGANILDSGCLKNLLSVRETYIKMNHIYSMIKDEIDTKLMSTKKQKVKVDKGLKDLRPKIDVDAVY